MRPRIDRVSIFKMLALNWDRKKIKREAKISERTFWNIKAEHDRLSEDRKVEIKASALGEEKARARFEDYEFVQKWIAIMKAERVKSWRGRFLYCRKIWLILEQKNPENWTSEDIKLRAKPELRKTNKSVFNHLTAVRSLRPDLKDRISTKREKLEPSFEWKYVYERIMEGENLELFLRAGGFKRELIKRLHVTLGCREGTRGIGGILGLEWNRINWENKTIDVYEGKTGGGFYWLDCPLDLFDETCFNMLREYWIQCGKPRSGKLFGDIKYAPRYKGDKGEFLSEIYMESAEAIG